MASAAAQSRDSDESGGAARRRRRSRSSIAALWWCGGAVALLLAFASASSGMQSKLSPAREEGTSSPSDWDFGFAPEGNAAVAEVGGVASPPVQVDKEAKSAAAAVKRLWGVPDVTAVVGRPFRLDVPKDAFTGQVERYEVYGPGNSPLPQWLALMDPRHGRMEGVPGASDVGELYVTLKAVAPSKKGMEEYELPEMAKDVFVIEVLPSPPWPSSANGKGVCINPLLVSVVLDADFNHLGAQSRARVVGVAASTFLGVTPGSLMLRAQYKEDRPDPSDGSVLAAGPGDASPMGRNAKRGSVLEWQIGCNGHIWQWKEKDPKGLVSASNTRDWREVSRESVAELRRHARDGSLSDVLGLPVVGWRVRRVGADGRPHGTAFHQGGVRPASHRMKREGGSGDFENGDDEEDEEGDDDIPKQWTEPWDGDYGFEEKTVERVPDTRIIPTMASPVFAEPTAVTVGSMGDSSHPHRHHHGEGGEDEDDDEEVYDPYAAVASGRNVMVTSPLPVYGTILPTPVLVPVRPTRFPGLDEDGNSIDASHFDELAGIIDATPSLSFIVASSHLASSMSSPSIAPSTTLWPATPSATADTSDLSPVVTEPLLPTTSKDSVDDVSSSTSASVTEDLRGASSGSTYEAPKSTVPSRPVNREEEVVIDIKNFPPTIHHRLRKIPVTAGNPLRYVVPDDIFTDLEDGNTRNLKLIFKTAEGEAVSPSSWVQFNPDNQEVYALPLEEHVSKWDFIIEAVDREGASVSDTLEVLVQHHKGRRTFHHEFSLVLHLEKKFDFPSDVDWQLRVLDGLRRLFGDDSIVVTSVGHQQPPDQLPPSYPDTLVFSWTNDTLPRTDCPKSDIEKLYKILALNDAGEPSSALRDVLSPEFKVKRVSYKGSGQCEGIGAGEEATPPVSKQPPKGPGERGKEDAKVPPILPPVATNKIPSLRNQVDHINATVGRLLVFRVPEDTFFDEEDGTTRNLDLSLLTMDRTPIPPDHWLQFDQRNQEFFGIPFTQDKGLKEYQLICKDSSGLSAYDGLVVAVHDYHKITASTRRRLLLPNQQLPTAHSFHNIEFVATLAMAHEKFDSSPSLKRKFVERLADLFGDRDTGAVLLYTITAGEDDGVAEDGGGSTLVSWFNTSLPVDKCPNKEVAHLRNILVAENGSPGLKEVSLSQHVQTTFGFELPIHSIDIIPINTCLGELSVIHFPEPPTVVEEDEDMGRDDGPTSTNSSSSADDYLITFIVPAVVIAGMILLAGLIACGLYRRRRRGKLSVAEKRGGAIGCGPLLAGANRGIPVIFQDELEERPPDPAKSPVIMKDEKPPLPIPPPEYQMAPNGGGGGGTGGGPQGGGLMPEPHTGTPLLAQGPRHHGSGGGPRRRGRGRDEGGGMLHGGEEDPGERGALMGGGRGIGMGLRGGEDDGEEDGDRVMVPVGGASSPPYHPPPPFTTNRDSGRGSRPKPTPTYRKPPPYVPP